MADKKSGKKKDAKKSNIFKRIGGRVNEVRTELKKVVWPTKDKMKHTGAVILVVILFFAVFLTLISKGGAWILTKTGFYDRVETTVTEASTASSDETVATEVVAVESEAVESEASEG